MKIRLSLLIIILFAAVKLNAQTDNAVLNSILSSYSERKYTSEPVTDQQLQLILNSGMKAPSGMNKQPWRFTVIRDEVTMKEIVKDVLPGNVLIIVSGTESQNGTPDFDCGLATESMFVAAHGLGLGARIYGSPVNNVNTNRDAYQIPEGFKPVMVLRVGNADKSVDAVSAATPRKSSEEVINYKK
jgi:nitroreductase